IFILKKRRTSLGLTTPSYEQTLIKTWQTRRPRTDRHRHSKCPWARRASGADSGWSLWAGHADEKLFFFKFQRIARISYRGGLQRGQANARNVKKQQIVPACRLWRTISD